MVTSAMPLEQAVWAALADVHDPEIPTISVVDLGVVHRVDVTPGRVRVELLPTFVGCPAIDVMRAAVVERLEGFAPVIEAEVTYERPWSTDRISPAGHTALRASGFGPPAGTLDDDGSLPVLPLARCPRCGSHATVLENAFGPTLCRAIYHCRACREPFEQFKSV
jgi:ring-1,2-phenylacetyl-CoA epoxidase subunit PaaD